MSPEEYYHVLKSLSDVDLLIKNDENEMRRNLARANMLSARSLAESGDSDDLDRFTRKFDVEDHKHQLSMDALIDRGFTYRDEDGWQKRELINS